MKLKQKSSKKKITLVIVGLLAVLIASIVGYAIYNTSQQNYKESHEDTAEFQDASPIDAQSEKQQQSYEEQRKEDQVGDHNDANPDTTLEVTFTSVSQMDNKVRIRAEVDTLIEDGTCTLTLVNGSSTVTKIADTYPTANVSTCQGFDIANSELSAGTWNVTLEVTKDSQTGQATTTVDVS